MKQSLRMKLNWIEIEQLERLLHFNERKAILGLLVERCDNFTRDMAKVILKDNDKWAILKEELEDYVEKNLMIKRNQDAYEQWFNEHSETIKEYFNK